MANAEPSTTMMPDELRSIRKKSGLSDNDFAKLVGVAWGRSVRRWETGDRAVPGPVVVLLRAILASEAVRAHFGVIWEGGS